MLYIWPAVQRSRSVINDKVVELVAGIILHTVNVAAESGLVKA